MSRQPRCSDDADASPVVACIGDEDVEALLAFEAEAFEPALRGTRERHLKRLSLGHQVLVCRAGRRILGALAFSFIRFDDDMPRTPFRDYDSWSTQPIPPDFNTLLIYSFAVVQGARQGRMATELLERAGEIARLNGCRHMVGDGRLDCFSPGRQRQDHVALRAVLARYEPGAPVPERLLLKQPHIAFYAGRASRNGTVSPLRVYDLIPDFLPGDRASGGWRAMLVLDFL